MLQHYEHEQNPQADRRHGEEIHRDHLAQVVVQERLPCLPGWSPKSAEDPRDRPLGDLDTEHLQLSMEPWRSPQGIVGDHLRYQPTNRERGRRSPTGVAFRPGQACPEPARTLPLPAHHPIRLNVLQRAAPARPHSG